jgi:RNA polymerase subunit RPABC4/transcription elongation factor Spt4
MQQVLDNHTRIVQMMSQILANSNDNLPWKDHGGKEPRGDVEMTLRACNVCGEIGHTSKDYHEQCPYCDTSHQLENVPWPKLLVSYAKESIMFLLNISFIPRCNEWINKPRMDWASC